MSDRKGREADLEWLMIASTIVRAHQHAAGTRKVKGGADPSAAHPTELRSAWLLASSAQGLGRSRGLSTKIHAAGDALGNPVRLLASPGERNDITLAHDLTAGFEPAAVLGDKGYDADPLTETVETSGAAVVFPPKRNRKSPRTYNHAAHCRLMPCQDTTASRMLQSREVARAAASIARRSR